MLTKSSLAICDAVSLRLPEGTSLALSYWRQARPLAMRFLERWIQHRQDRCDDAQNFTQNSRCLCAESRSRLKRSPPFPRNIRTKPGECFEIGHAIRSKKRGLSNANAACFLVLIIRILGVDEKWRRAVPGSWLDHIARVCARRRSGPSGGEVRSRP